MTMKFCGSLGGVGAPVEEPLEERMPRPFIHSESRSSDSASGSSQGQRRIQEEKAGGRELGVCCPLI